MQEAVSAKESKTPNRPHVVVGATAAGQYFSNTKIPGEHIRVSNAAVFDRAIRRAGGSLHSTSTTKKKSMAIAEDNPNYNKLFSKFVDPNSPESDQLEGLVVCGLYRRAKSEWAKSLRRASGRAPTSDELTRRHATWTLDDNQAISDRATSALAVFARSVGDEAAPEIRRKAPEATFLKNVITNVAGTFACSVILILIVRILRWCAVDIRGLFQKSGSSGR
ncbi:MAG: hypothetical protein N2444_03195 [Methylocystis sp.]|nr:hypothetical protein [Methylocystis sp.]